MASSVGHNVAGAHSTTEGLREMVHNHPPSALYLRGTNVGREESGSGDRPLDCDDVDQGTSDHS